MEGFGEGSLAGGLFWTGGLTEGLLGAQLPAAAQFPGIEWPRSAPYSNAFDVLEALVRL